MYGFMHYDKVCDVDKLSRALNNVYLSRYRVWDNVACVEKVERHMRVITLHDMKDKKRAC